jgi:RNA binding exosome subunit
MTSETLATIEKMLEPLPDSAQEQIVEHLREYIAEMQSEWRWERLYKEKSTGLEKMARLAKQQIAEGKAHPLNTDEL